MQKAEIQKLKKAPAVSSEGGNLNDFTTLKASESSDSDLAGQLRHYASFFREENFSDLRGRFLCGDVLLEVKKLLPRGEFSEWLFYNFPLDHRLAQNWMNMSRYLNREKVIDLDIPAGSLYILARPSTPKAAQEFVYDLYRVGETVSRREVSAIVKYFSGRFNSLPPRFCKKDTEQQTTILPSEENQTSQFDHDILLDEIEDGQSEVEQSLDLSEEQPQLKSERVNRKEEEEPKHLLDSNLSVQDEQNKADSPFLDLSTFSKEYESSSEVSDYQDCDPSLPFEKTACLLLKPKGAPYVLTRSIRRFQDSKTGKLACRSSSNLEESLLPLNCWEFYGKNFSHLVVNAPFRYFALRQRCPLLVKYVYPSVYWLSYILEEESSLSRAYFHLASDLNFFNSLSYNLLGVSTFTFTFENFSSSYEEAALIESCSSQLGSFSDFQFTLLVHRIPNVNFLVDLEYLNLSMSIVVFDENLDRVHSALRAWQSAFGRESVRHFYPGLFLPPSNSSTLSRRRKRSYRSDSDRVVSRRSV